MVVGRRSPFLLGHGNFSGAFADYLPEGKPTYSGYFTPFITGEGAHLCRTKYGVRCPTSFQSFPWPRDSANFDELVGQVVGGWGPRWLVGSWRMGSQDGWIRVNITLVIGCVP